MIIGSVYIYKVLLQLAEAILRIWMVSVTSIVGILNIYSNDA